MKDFCHQIFPELNKTIHIKDWLEGRVILAPINEEVDDINETMQDWLEGNSMKLRSADHLANASNILRFNVEYLNTLVPNRFPRHTVETRNAINATAQYNSSGRPI